MSLLEKKYRMMNFIEVAESLADTVLNCSEIEILEREKTRTIKSLLSMGVNCMRRSISEIKESIEEESND